MNQFLLADGGGSGGGGHSVGRQGGRNKNIRSREPGGGDGGVRRRTALYRTLHVYKTASSLADVIATRCDPFPQHADAVLKRFVWKQTFERKKRLRSDIFDVGFKEEWNNKYTQHVLRSPARAAL